MESRAHAKRLLRLVLAPVRMEVSVLAPRNFQEGRKHTDTSNRRSPGKYMKILEVGGETTTHKIWDTMGNPIICVYLFVSQGPFSFSRWWWFCYGLWERWRF
ncbi:unnamed protein product [Prorocentrum cordatum]|uniref:Uncharacterized protein n=1 Tax=Prorocentrum cordatum TaxID=2364126 RepID=A0ABN9S6A8_9DINO|nr:unnamed protein product [Polarella glacialis]